VRASARAALIFLMAAFQNPLLSIM
jgi:hypothetical protein